MIIVIIISTFKNFFLIIKGIDEKKIDNSMSFGKFLFYYSNDIHCKSHHDNILYFNISISIIFNFSLK